MSRIFLGKPFHWLVLVAIAGILWWMGAGLLQTRNFNLFLIILIGISTAGVLVIRLTYQRGERITRDPFDDEDL